MLKSVITLCECVPLSLILRQGFAYAPGRGAINDHLLGATAQLWAVSFLRTTGEAEEADGEPVIYMPTYTLLRKL